jgi:spore germination cell wall hydrolase CwlJ-like protein
MSLKFRAVAIAAAVFAFAGSAFVGGPALAYQGPIALPSISYLDHPVPTLGASPIGLGDHAVAAPADAHMLVDVHSLDALVANEAAEQAGDAEQECLANAVYFEARGEPLQGQLAVAEVVMNRAASGRFPASLCGVVVQRAQFSFVRRGRMPHADRASEAWRRAVGVARVAAARMAPRQLPATCLWYHANYVSPGWGRRLALSARIGLHIFYS